MLRQSTKRLIYFGVFLLMISAAIYAVYSNRSENPSYTESSFDLIPLQYGDKELAAAIAFKDINDIVNGRNSKGFRDILATVLHKIPGFNSETEITEFLNVLKKYKTFTLALYVKGKDISVGLFFDIKSLQKNHQFQEILELTRKTPLFKDMHIKSFDDGSLLLSNDEILMEMVSNKSSYEKNNLYKAYPFITEFRYTSAPLSIFTRNQILTEEMSSFTERLFGIKFRTTQKPEVTLHNIFFKDGLLIVSESPSDTPAAEARKYADQKYLSLLYNKNFIAGINSSYKSGKTKDLPGLSFTTFTDYFDTDFIKDVRPYIKGPVVYSLMETSSDSMNIAFPGLAYFIEVSDPAGQEYIIKRFKENFKKDFSREELSGIGYEFLQLPLFFGQTAELCIFKLAKYSKKYIVFCTSRNTCEKIIKANTDNQSNLYKDTYIKRAIRKLPAEFSSFSYYDLNALCSTVGIFAASMKRDKKLADFFLQLPFSAITPIVSASKDEESKHIVYTYFQFTDQTEDKLDIILDYIK